MERQTNMQTCIHAYCTNMHTYMHTFQKTYVCIFIATSTTHKIKYKAHGQDGNIEWGEAECYITIEAKRWVLYFFIAWAMLCFKWFMEPSSLSFAAILWNSWLTNIIQITSSRYRGVALVSAKTPSERARAHNQRQLVSRRTKITLKYD